MNCSKCWKLIKLGEGIKHDCEHNTHALCLPKNPTDKDFEKCFKCRNQQQTLPIKEITSFDGYDYVENPIATQQQPNEYINKIFKDCDTIEEIVLGHGLHLQEMLFNGVTIDTFLQNGFDWKDLIKIQDLSNPGEKRIKALFALKCNAEDFHNYPDKLPVKELKITPLNLIDDFGLYFPKDGLLSTHYGQNDFEWTLNDLKKLGIRNTDLWDAGLQSARQYEGLLPTRDEINQMFPQQPQRKHQNDYNSNIIVKPARHGLRKK